MHNCFYEENCSSKQHQLFQLQFLVSHLSKDILNLEKVQKFGLRWVCPKQLLNYQLYRKQEVDLKFYIAYTQWAFFFHMHGFITLHSTIDPITRSSSTCT